MPLIHSPSKKAFEKNIRTEIVQGKKPQKQAVAIAYAVKRKAKKASGGEIDWADIDEDRPKPRRYANPHDYDSDVDFYKAVGDPRGNEDEGEDTAPRMSEIKKHKSTKLVNKLTANRQMADIAKASGNKAESEKQFGRLERRGESNRLRDFAKSAEKRGDKAKADTHRKEWSEKVGKGKPAPFKAGGKVKNSCW